MTVDGRPASAHPREAIAALLDRAVQAVNDGDLAAAHDLAGQVLAEDADNREATDLLATGKAPTGEVRRLTILSCDVVGSTELSERLDVERYRWVISAFMHLAQEIIEDRYDGHINSVTGDGVFALFGYPTAHEEDAARGVKAALDICRAVKDLSARTQASVGECVSVRVAVHRGLVFVDAESGEVYGLAANVASRLEGLAEPGQVVISDEIRTIVTDWFATEPSGVHTVKGVAEPLGTFTVLGELPESAKLRFGAPMVGRDSELDALRAAWRTVRDGEPARAHSIAIRGEPGVGKSRLAATIASDVRDAHAPLIELAGSSFHVDAGFHPVRRLIETRCRIGPSASPAERLNRLRTELEAAGCVGDDAVALIAPVLGLSPDAGYEPASADGRKLNEEITGAIKHYLLSCFAGRPGLLLVEDVQWFDGSTTAMLTELLRQPRTDLLVVLTSRVDLPMTTDSTLDLAPLTAADCDHLVDALSGGAMDPRARRAVVERSDGIPLYVEEIVRSGALATEGRPGAVPDVLYEPLVARLYTTAHGVRVAAAAATIGRVVDHDLLAGVLDLSDSELDTELAALVAGKVLIGIDERRYRFRHELLREVAYELLPVSQRQRVHERVADLLVGTALDADLIDWSVVAAHYAHARRHGEAADAYGYAAEGARTRGAIPEARAQLGRAIDHLQHLPDDRDRMRREVALRLRRGFLAMTAEALGSVGAAADFARCLELAMVDARGVEMFSTLISLWAYHLARGELDQATQVLDTLLSTLTGGREYFRAANRAGFGMVQWFRGDFRGATAVLEEAVANLVIDDTAKVDTVWFVPNDPAASMHTHLALARFMTGDTAGADAELARSGKVTAALAFPQGPWSRAYAGWLESWIRVEQGDFAGATITADSLVELAIRHGFDSWTTIGMTQRAAVDAARAVSTDVAPDAAKLHADTLAGFVSLWTMAEILVFLPYYMTTTAAALAAGGDTAGARDRCQEALALAERTGMHFYDAETRRRLALLAEDDVTIDAELRAALALAREQGARPFELRIALDLHDRGAAEGRDALAAAVAAFPGDACLADLARARALLTPTA